MVSDRPDGKTGERAGEVEGLLGRVPVQGGEWGRADIPELVVKKLARIAGLDYRQKAPEGGGGLCMGIEGVKRRRKALKLLGVMCGQVGKGSLNSAVAAAGATWLDLVGWREDEEYARLWAAAVKVRREVAAACLEDILWSRAVDGFDVEEAKMGRDGEVQKVTVRKFDNGTGVQMLKSLGYVGKDCGVRAVGLDGQKAPPPAPAAPAAPAEPDDDDASVMYADRASAFREMGKALPDGGAPAVDVSVRPAGGKR